MTAPRPLDAWIRRKARAHQASGASRTHVLCRGTQVVGFHALAAGSVSHALSPRKLRPNMPDPVPAIVLGRLAVDVSEQGNGRGRALLRDAVLRVAGAAREVGVGAMLVHALNDRAKAFHASAGFDESPVDPSAMVPRIKDINALIGD